MDRTDALLYAILLAVVGNAAVIASGNDFGGVGALLLVVALLFGTAAFFAEFDEAGDATAGGEQIREGSDSSDGSDD